MQRRLMFGFTALVLFSLLLAPLGLANAQGNQPPAPRLEKQGQSPVNGARQDENGLWYMPAGVQTSAQEIVPLTTGGPDMYGYTWDDSVPYSWIDTTTGTNTGLTGFSYGNGTGLISLPFPFKFYENTYTGLYIAASGYVGFTDSYWASQQKFPSPNQPNNVIAPYWAPTLIDTDSWVHYKSGGTAPNRYFVVEWHNVKDNFSPDGHFTFEVILHENNDVVFQYAAMTYGAGWPCGESGIEDSDGIDGLVYANFCNHAPSNDAVRFYRPPLSAHIKLTRYQGGLAQPDSLQTYQIEVRNTGELGDDVYDMTATSIWPVTLYAADGITELTDTDTDAIVDTGTISQGGSASIIATVQVPAMAGIGDFDFAAITATSSLDTNKSQTASLQTSIPAPFVDVFQDNTDGAMSLDVTQPDAHTAKKATADGRYGYNLAIAPAPNGNLVYAWDTGQCLTSPCNFYINEIEYTLLDHAGNVLRAASKLVDHSAATMTTTDGESSIAVAPDGTIGILWTRYLYNSAIGKSNYNIFFATLNSAGNLSSGPINITNNTTWYASGDQNRISFFAPTIAATSDGRFVLGWAKYVGSPSYYYNIWYSVRSTGGGQVLAPIALTNDNDSWSPILNSLSGGKAILTFLQNGDPSYAVVSGSGAVVIAAASLGAVGAGSTPDAVLLPGNKVALAWPTSTGAGFAILDSTYAIESGPAFADTSLSVPGYGLSTTADINGHVIMTWANNSTGRELFYAMGDSAGTFITPPIVYKTSENEISISYNGQGNTYNTTFGDVPPAYWSATWIERLYNAGITGGCATSPNLLYCPANPVNRAQMAIFLLRAEHGSDYVPPAATGIFEDVDPASSTAPWIEQLYNEGITGGCSTTPMKYCPNNPITRAQMAIFLLRAEHGSDYTPPAAVGKFEDVPADTFTAPFIEQLSNEGITGGCSVTPMLYCPTKTVTRDQMAIFLVRTFNLP